MRFDGKVALVTGGGSGIGRAIAEGIVARGGRVVLADRDATAAGDVATSLGDAAIALTVDLADSTAIAPLVEAARAAFGRIDVLHNNAFGLPADLAARRVARIDALDPEVWALSIQIGLTAVMLATRFVVPIMRAQGGGAIVNTASVAALIADAGSASYNTVKAGLLNLTRSTAIEFARDNIRANAILPGAIDTPLLRSGASARGVSPDLGRFIPIGRVGTPEEAANVALFLASDLASFVTGSLYAVDGGLTATSGFATSYERSAL